MDGQKFTEIDIPKEDFAHLEIKYTMNQQANPQSNDDEAEVDRGKTQIDADQSDVLILKDKRPTNAESQELYLATTCNALKNGSTTF